MQEDGALPFTPELIPRRGELIAWLLTVGVIAGWLILNFNNLPVVWGLPLFGILLLVSAMGISFGNWMDRHTSISLDPGSIIYRDGLRKVQLGWEEIRNVRVLPSEWGSKIQVFGDTGYFAFRTLGEVVLRGDVKGTMGFKNGEEILRLIVLNSRLQVIDHPGEGIYYSRL